MNKEGSGSKKSFQVSRVQSPSSILTHKQCPRKYYYKYIEKMPTVTNIHLIRGSVVHKVLEDFFEIDTADLSSNNFLFTLKVVLHELFKEEWSKKKSKLSSLEMEEKEIRKYYNETKRMIDNFHEYVVEKVSSFNNVEPEEAFQKIKPITEVKLKSSQHKVRGFVDAVQKQNGTTTIIDYKTSKKNHLTDKYKLQLGIYSMIYKEKHGMPDKAGILFLKHGEEKLMNVDEDVLSNAERECRAIHINTQSEEMEDYPRKPGPLCKWSSGQCDFYDTCFNKKIIDY